MHGSLPTAGMNTPPAHFTDGMAEAQGREGTSLSHRDCQWCSWIYSPALELKSSRGQKGQTVIISRL